MRNACFIAFILVLVAACHHPPFSINYRDKHDRLQGRWRVYYPDGKHLYYSVRYRNNIPRGKFKYYYKSGQLMRLEDYRRNKQIKTTYYYENGVIELQGNAQRIQRGDTNTYEWYGTWRKFDTLGVFTEERTYMRGQLIWLKKMTPAP